MVELRNLTSKTEINKTTIIPAKPKTTGLPVRKSQEVTKEAAAINATLKAILK